MAMLILCAKCKTPQECGVVKGYCPLRVLQAQLAATQLRDASAKAAATCQTANSSLGLLGAENASR